MNITPHSFHLIAKNAACAAIFTLANISNASLLVYDGFLTPGDYTADTSIDGIGGGTGDWTGNWSVGSGTADAALDSIPVSGLEQSSGKIVANDNNRLR